MCAKSVWSGAGEKEHEAVDAVTEPEDGSSGWLSSDVETGRDFDGLGALDLAIVAERTGVLTPYREVRMMEVDGTIELVTTSWKARNAQARNLDEAVELQVLTFFFSTSKIPGLQRTS